MSRRREHWKGITVTFVGVLVLSCDALLIRASGISGYCLIQLSDAVTYKFVGNTPHYQCNGGIEDSPGNGLLEQWSKKRRAIA